MRFRRLVRTFYRKAPNRDDKNTIQSVRKLYDDDQIHQMLYVHVGMDRRVKFGVKRCYLKIGIFY
jgi:hypothetical protein